MEFQLSNRDFRPKVRNFTSRFCATFPYLFFLKKNVNCYCKNKLWEIPNGEMQLNHIHKNMIMRRKLFRIELYLTHQRPLEFILFSRPFRMQK